MQKSNKKAKLFHFFCFFILKQKLLKIRQVIKKAGILLPAFP